MFDFNMILTALIELGRKTGQLTDTEVLQSLDCLEAADLTKAQAPWLRPVLRSSPVEPQFYR